jgi:hypothetical protein
LCGHHYPVGRRLKREPDRDGYRKASEIVIRQFPLGDINEACDTVAAKLDNGYEVDITAEVRRWHLVKAGFAPPVGIEPTTDRLETDHDQQ